MWVDQFPLSSLSGGILGGFAAGFLWSAQGPYFAKNAALYHEAIIIDNPEVTKADVMANFAASFAVPYLLLEVTSTLNVIQM